mmetsp:Transcript_28451/g.47288  ORF Transcript_28451/g.47288 Transcript_28451/m.47288 type:complete len:80 (+) Transcript_28451:13-252(+)
MKNQYIFCGIYIWAYFKASFNLLQASTTESLGANALSRKNPSPPGPKPAPGMVTTCAFSKIMLKAFQDPPIDSGSSTKT